MTRSRGLRRSLARVAAAALAAGACGSAAGGSTAHVSLHAVETRSGCPATAPRQAPYHGWVVLTAEGSPRAVRTDARGDARLGVPAGRYEVSLPAAPPLRRVLRARLDGRTLRPSGGRLAVTLRGGAASTLGVVIALGPGECASPGTES